MFALRGFLLLHALPVYFTVTTVECALFSMYVPLASGERKKSEQVIFPA